MKLSPSKHRRLRAAGWRIGGAAEFLGLSAEETVLVEVHVALAAAVRARRAGRGWTQAELARRLASSQSRVAKVEAGDPSVSLDLLVRALVTLGATRRDLGRILQARAA